MNIDRGTTSKNGSKAGLRRPPANDIKNNNSSSTSNELPHPRATLSTTCAKVASKAGLRRPSGKPKDNQSSQQQQQQLAPAHHPKYGLRRPGTNVGRRAQPPGPTVERRDRVRAKYGLRRPPQQQQQQQAEVANNDDDDDDDDDLNDDAMAAPLLEPNLLIGGLSDENPGTPPSQPENATPSLVETPASDAAFEEEEEGGSDAGLVDANPVSEEDDPDLPMAQEFQNSRKKQQKRKKFLLPMVAVAGGILVGVAVLLALAFSGNGDAAPPPEQTVALTSNPIKAPTLRLESEIRLALPPNTRTNILENSASPQALAFHWLLYNNT